LPFYLKRLNSVAKRQNSLARMGNKFLKRKYFVMNSSLDDLKRIGSLSATRYIIQTVKN